MSAKVTALRVPETNKKPGIHYAVTDDGIELPIVDVTHPAFASQVSEDEQRGAVEQFLREGKRIARVPPSLRKWLMRIFLRGSILAPGIEAAGGTFLNGMTTYLLKLGPEHLGRGYANEADRRIAASVPARSMRWRLYDMARLVSDALAPALSEGRQQPIHLLNIAGGPAMDSLNGLILAHRERSLAGRRVSITVLDGDANGPAFGARALGALLAKGAPLAGLDVELRHVPYDWTRVDTLRAVLGDARTAGAWVLASSEGGLFEYGSDRDIVDNLQVLREGVPDGFAMVGSVTRNDEPVQVLLQTGNSAAIRPRGLATFRGLAERAGFAVTRVIPRPFSDHVVLCPARV